MKEIDMIIESDGVLHPLEVKRSVNPGKELIGAFDILNKSSAPQGEKALFSVCAPHCRLWTLITTLFLCG